MDVRRPRSRWWPPVGSGGALVMLTMGGKRSWSEQSMSLSRTPRRRHIVGSRAGPPAGRATHLRGLPDAVYEEIAPRKESPE